MNQEYTYLFINIFTIIIPFLFSFHPKIQFYKKWKFFFPGLIAVATFFIIWDIIFTNKGIWYFNQNMVTGIKIANLPLEEVLFFITIPYACVFTYEVLSGFWKNKDFTIFGRIATVVVLVFLLYGIMVYPDRLYTIVTFSILILFLLLIKLFVKSDYINIALFAYTILLIPFFLVNGYLTGMFTEEPVVLYNNSENMGIRMITIPVEDTFYGLLLFLMNISLFEYFKRSSVLNSKALSG